MTAPRTVGVIRVVTTDDWDFLEAHGRVLEQIHGYRTVTACLPGQRTGVHDDRTFAAASQKMPAAARTLVAEGAEAVIISCAADPGLAWARAAVNVPVIGAGSAGAAIARATGGSVGVLGITEEVPESVTAVLGDRLVASRVPDGVTRTSELTTAAGARAAIAAAVELRDAGATSILFACTGFTTLDLADPVREATGLPVVDSIRAAGAVAAEALDGGPTPTADCLTAPALTRLRIPSTQQR
ncbi:hydantoin racemase [Occultella glacieicola]|uniref:Hydantoin racemase n=1 Tax=Occultella glacieicola TaxID=2518684 RepID=A0ABY2E3E3_9MICO|nr:aspartate/glutamate racemase family protein [Occultella glacieicola]TDE94148.1 hydantoin racemase [Occultella glacieicola]